MREYRNPALSIAGIVVDKHEEQTVSGRERVAELREAVYCRGIQVLALPAPKRVVISYAVETTRALGAFYAAHLAAIEGVSA
ncbi:hypothetical protein [Microbacterium stercoris]|uniref:Uncharacterized protein n=1 Tax=Microbacterium stercoris TaxID=2820289 RepID=A0A939QQC5_9MICO|nr:hypothetical protein [Microbacterium stercoris]MBO3662711.1 hypothetical protein [Microbacterium stercoris]